MRKKCECGCGDYANSGKRFIIGHCWRRKKHSPETKEKISKSLMGRTHTTSEETKKKISVGNTGKVRSEETRRKLSKAREGQTVSEETKRKTSETLKGHAVSKEARKKSSDTQRKRNSNWNKYHPYMAPYQFRELLDRVKERDRLRCVLCSKKKMPHTHHIVPVRIGYKSRLCDHESNMVYLCTSCHARVESAGGAGFDKDKWKEFLPFAKKYLSQFGYEEMLLDEYLPVIHVQLQN